MIYYLSCTGNTLWVAQQLAKLTHDRIRSMTESRPSDALSPDERLGFCFPVYGWQPPRLVLDFVQRLHLNVTGRYVYALCTCGDNIGRTMDVFADAMAARNISLHSRFSVIMPESYVGLPFMDVDKPADEYKKIEQAKGKLQNISQRIKQRMEGDYNLVKGPFPWLYTHVLGAFFQHILVTDRHFYVDKSACVRCGKCANVCPVDNVLGGPGIVPQWRHNTRCHTCFACYHHCPRHAIGYGCMTRYKGQYFMKKTDSDC